MGSVNGAVARRNSRISRLNAWIRAAVWRVSRPTGANASASNSSRSPWSSAPTLMEWSTTASPTAYSTAPGPCRRISGCCSSRRRTTASGLAVPCRTVTTNASPTKTISSEAVTVSAATS